MLGKSDSCQRRHWSNCANFNAINNWDHRQNGYNNITEIKNKKKKKILIPVEKIKMDAIIRQHFDLE